MLAHIFVLLAILAIVAADASWQLTQVTKVTSLIGVFSTHGNEAYGAVLDNSLGSGVAHTKDYGDSNDFTNVGLMNMDIAFTADAEVGAVIGFGGVYLTANGGGNFTKVASLHTVSQNIEPFLTKGFGATGQFALGRNSVNGVAVTKDAGNTWNIFDINMPDNYLARYASFPSENTWYVTSGMWPDSGVKDFAALLSKNIYVNSKNEPKFASKFEHQVRDETGYYGGISKTTDGGKTWTQVFDAQGVYYMNGISCADDLNCIAVGENDTGYIVGTQDGGATWNTLYTAEGVSLMAVKMLSATEAWAAGGGENNRRQLIGYYYHTTDAGKTWEVLTGSGYAMDLTFSEGIGYSAALTSSYGTIAIYR